MKGGIKTDVIEIKRITRDCYEQLYTNKFDKLEDMNRFLEAYNQPRLNMKK